MILRLLRGIRDRIAWISAGVFGPPLAALHRLLLALRDGFDRLIARLLELWGNIWGAAPRDDDEREALNPPSATSLILAAFVLAVSLYTWPSWIVLGPVVLYPLAVVVWLASYLVLRRMSRSPRQRFAVLLRAAERRVGLLWGERLGAILAVGLGVVGVLRQPVVIPLAVALALGYLRLLGVRYALRELTRVPAPPPPPPEPVPTDDDGSLPEGYVSRRFAWTMRAGILADDHAVDVAVHEPTYRRLREENPGREWDGDDPLFNKWVVDGSTPEVERTAATLAALSRERNYSTFAEISNALAFVQSIPYSRDEDTMQQTDYWRYPIETLYDSTGDCEDTTILAAAVLRRMGHRVGTMLLPEHAALAVEAPSGTPGDFILHEGRAMYYCETTGTGWRVGQLPAGLRGKSVSLYMID